MLQIHNSHTVMVMVSVIIFQTQLDLAPSDLQSVCIFSFFSNFKFGSGVPNVSTSIEQM